MTNSAKLSRNLISLVIGVIISGTALHLFTGREKVFVEHGSKSYGILAESLVNHHTLALDGQTPTAYRPPLYPMFLALLLWTTGTLQTALAVQSLLLGLTLGLLTLMAWQIKAKWWLALVILLLYAYLDEIVLENITQRDTGIFTFLLVASAYLFISLNGAYRWWKVVAWATVMGLMALVRPMAAMGIIFAGLWAIYLLFQRVSPAQIARRLAIFLLVFYALLLPWGLRNWLALDRLTITSTTGGLNLWKGNNPGTAIFYPLLDVDILDDLIKELPEESGWWNSLRRVSEMSEVEQDDYFYRLAVTYIQEEPAQFLNIGMVKLYALWLPLPHPTGKGDAEWKPDRLTVDKFNAIRSPLAPYLLLYILAGIGYWRAKNTALGWHLLFWVLFLSLIHFVTFGETRFRWPINVLSLPLAAIGLDAIGESVRSFWKNNEDSL